MADGEAPTDVLPPSSEGERDRTLMKLALEEAYSATKHGDVPVGAVLVDAGGAVLARGHNRREVDADPTAHAELLVLRAACHARGHWRLDDCTLYVTLEPCAMCSGALVNARIGRLVFGAYDKKAGFIASLASLHQDERLNHRFPAQGGVEEEPCRSALQEFFRALRAQGQK